jgi:metal-responsive CopG/Arc/MetJ family transcriptional regulator
MAKKREGFRLDLREPLASELTRFCKINYRKKTEVVRQALAEFLRRNAMEIDKERRRREIS